MNAIDLDTGAAERYLEDRITAVVESMSVEALKVLAVRLGALPEGCTYQDVYIWLSQDLAEVETILAGGADLVSAEYASFLEEAAQAADEWAQPFFDYRGIEQAPALEDACIAHTIRTGAEEAEKVAKRYCSTRAVGIVGKNGVLSLRDSYERMLSESVRRMAQGESMEDILPSLVEELSSSGLRVRYKSGATRDLYSAVRLVMEDGYTKTMGEIREQKASDFGADGYAISAHAYCAPDHLPYQGKRYTFEEFDAVQNKLKRPIGQYNCRHHTTKCIVGIGRGAYTAKQLDNIRHASQRDVTFGRGENAKTMSAYEFTQRQRQLETRCRKLRGAAQIADAAGETDLRDKYRRAADNVARQYETESGQAHVPTRPERLRIYDWSTLN